VLKRADVGQVISQNTPNLQLKGKLSAFKPIWQEEIKFTHAELSLKRLERFTRYWEKVGPEVMANAKTDSPTPEKITP
jgi:deoxyribodipyrimidine photo-lyase